MSKWEYSFVFAELQGNAWIAEYRNQTGPLGATCQQLGEEGWEMVGSPVPMVEQATGYNGLNQNVTYRHKVERILVTFKRSVG